MNEIKLPPLPRPDAEFGTHSRKQIREYTRSSIELDRQGRGEPVYQANYLGQGWQDTSLSRFIYLSGAPESGKENWHLRILYAHPQPAAPAVKESLTVAEPVKDAVRIYNSGYMAGHQDTVEGCFTDILSADMASYHEDAVSELVNDLRDHQPAEPVKVPSVPDGWKLVPVRPTDLMTSKGQEARYPTSNSISVIYQAMLASAPPADGQAVDWEAMYDQMRERCDSLDGKLDEYEAQPDPAMAGDDPSLIEQLREHAADNGYSHIDYADTMTAAADALERVQPASGEDSTRLDWIEKNARRDPKMDGNHVYWPTAFNQTIRGPSLREAIDRAMQQERQP